MLEYYKLDDSGRNKTLSLTDLFIRALSTVDESTWHFARQIRTAVLFLHALIIQVVPEDFGVSVSTPYELPIDLQAQASRRFLGHKNLSASHAVSRSARPGSAVIRQEERMLPAIWHKQLLELRWVYTAQL